MSGEGRSIRKEKGPYIEATITAAGEELIFHKIVNRKGTQRNHLGEGGGRASSREVHLSLGGGKNSL